MRPDDDENWGEIIDFNRRIATLERERDEARETIQRMQLVVDAAREHRERIRQFCARMNRTKDDDGPEDVLTAAQEAQERFKRSVDDYDAWQKFERAVDALEADDGETVGEADSGL
jgi:hypothetical protein